MAEKRETAIMKGRPEFPVVGQLVKCSKCGRKILVERALIGVNHSLGIHATCWECLDKESQKRAVRIYKLKEGKSRGKPKRHEKAD